MARLLHVTPKTLKRIGLASLIGVAASLAPASAPSDLRSPARADERPNVLIIVTDDQRRDLMPALPKTLELFEGGGRSFTNGFATTPMCCPSRASILTGRYAHNHGVIHNGAPLDVDNERMLQSRLQEQGYRTGLFGKFLNSWRKWKPPPGFDTFAMGAGYSGRNWNIDGVFEPVEAYNTDVIGQNAESFIRDAASDDRPWLAVVTPFAPHPPYEAEPKYESTPVPPMSPTMAMREANRSDKPWWIRRQTNTFVGQMDLEREQQYRTLLSVDDLVDRLFTTLDQTDQDNTLAFFLSDNGYLWGEHGLKRKGYAYNDSIRIPFYVRWPAKVSEGSVDHRIIANIDIAPTVLSNLGMPVEGTDGRDILAGYETQDPETGDVVTTAGRKHLLVEFWCNKVAYQCKRWASLRTKRWQYVEHYDADMRIRAREYYDLVDDPGQLRNLFGDRNQGNDPAIGPLARKLYRAKTCKGSTCP